MAMDIGGCPSSTVSLCRQGPSSVEVTGLRVLCSVFWVMACLFSFRLSLSLFLGLSHYRLPCYLSYLRLLHPVHLVHRALSLVSSSAHPMFVSPPAFACTSMVSLICVGAAAITQSVKNYCAAGSAYYQFLWCDVGSVGSVVGV